jgi:alkylated DNA repair protein (DNA oxidative demethylase)
MARRPAIADNARMTLDLFADEPALERRDEPLAPGAVLLRGFARERGPVLLEALEAVTARAVFRFLITPGGYRMSVAMTNCGSVGWISDRTGYRYGPIDPLTGQQWPALPAAFVAVATEAAAAAGFPSFAPDACLINQYEPGSRLSLHQDKDEQDYDAPIVSVSLGLPAVFLFGGGLRSDKTQRVPLAHGDVVVWGGPARLRYHGVLPLKDGEHPLLGRRRINLTFRKAL